MTAVEWLEEQIVKFHNWKLNPTYDKSCFDEIELNNAIQKAKEMEKQQIIDAFEDGYGSGYRDNGKLGSEYFDETFKNNKL